MDLKFTKTNKFPLFKTGIFTALALIVAASGIGTYSFLKKQYSNPDIPSTEIDWHNQGGNLEADVPATKVTVPQTAPTTQPQTTAPPDNLPFTGNFALPLGTQILKDYSNGEMVSSKTMNDWRVHNGIDFTGTEGAEILSIQSGTVTDVFSDDLWGLVVVIDHGNTMVAKYCGLKEGTTLKKGETVKKGGVIGKLGTIPVEQADGHHLHLEITVNETVVDPLAAMNRAS